MYTSGTIYYDCVCGIYMCILKVDKMLKLSSLTPGAQINDIPGTGSFGVIARKLTFIKIVSYYQ